GRSMAPIRCNSEDLPLPLGPTIATIPLAGTARSMASSALMLSWPFRYILLTSRSAISALSPFATVELFMANGLHGRKSDDLPHAPHAPSTGGGDAYEGEQSEGGGAEIARNGERIGQGILVFCREERRHAYAEGPLGDLLAPDTEEQRPQQ